MFNLDQCPICGALHDDGGFYRVGDSRVFLCMECSDKAPEDKDKREEWLEQKLGSRKEMFARQVQRW